MTSTISLNHTKITSLRTIWISTSVLLCKKSLIVYISVYLYAKYLLGIFHGGSGGKEIACNAGDPDLIPGSRRSPEEGNGYPVQYSCLENSMDRGAWWATVHGVAKSQTWLKWLSMHTHTHAPTWCWGPQEIVRWASSLNKCDLVQITQSLPPNHFFFLKFQSEIIDVWQLCHVNFPLLDITVILEFLPA